MHMLFFKRKKEEETMKDIKEIKEVVEKEIPSQEPESTEEKPVKEEKLPKIEEPKKPSFAPLFVKIDRYKTVLNLLGEIKEGIILLKNSLTVQKQVEDLLDENKSIVNGVIEKLEKRILSLDSEFLRPSDYEERSFQPRYEPGTLENVMSDLKTQLETLKSELKKMS